MCQWWITVGDPFKTPVFLCSGTLYKSAVFVKNRLWDYIFFFIPTGHQSSKWCDAISMHWQAMSDGWLTTDDYLSRGVFLVPRANLLGTFSLLVQIARLLEMDWEENTFAPHKSKSAVKNDQLCLWPLTRDISKQQQCVCLLLDHTVKC